METKVDNSEQQWDGVLVGNFSFNIPIKGGAETRELTVKVNFSRLTTHLYGYLLTLEVGEKKVKLLGALGVDGTIVAKGGVIAHNEREKEEYDFVGDSWLTVARKVAEFVSRALHVVETQLTEREG